MDTPQPGKNEEPKGMKKPEEKKPDKNAPVVPVIITKQMDDLMRRIRLLEERYSGLRKKTQVTEQNMLKDTRDLTSEIKILNENVTDLKRSFSEINDKLIKMQEEMNTAVKKADFNVIAKYLEFWEPMNFLTRKEAERIIDDMVKR